MTSALQYCVLEGLRWHYFEDGPEAGQPLLLLHGFPDTPHSFEALAQTLASAGYRVFRPYLPGYAPSHYHGPFSMKAVVRRLLQFVRDRCGSPAYLVGHDWGAILSYALCCSAPDHFVRAATLSVPHPRHTVHRALRDPAQLRRSAYVLLFQLPMIAETLAQGTLVRRLWRAWSPDLQAPEGLLREAERCIANSGSAPFHYYRELARALLDRSLFGRVALPLLYLHGQDDACVAAGLADDQEHFLPAGYRRQIIPGAGHFLHVESPELVGKSVLEFFSEP